MTYEPSFCFLRIRGSWNQRRSSSFNTERIDSVLPYLQERGAKLLSHFGDLNDFSKVDPAAVGGATRSILPLGCANSGIRNTWAT